jgi:hypothetical protein
MVVIVRKTSTNGHSIIGREEEDRKIIAQPNDALYEKQKLGRRYGRR